MRKRFFLLAACLSLVCSCSSNNEKKLVGKWQELNNPKGVLIFFRGHKGEAYWPDEGGAQQMSTMRWEMVKKENKVSVITPPGPVVFEIKDNRLLAPNGVILTKVK